MEAEEINEVTETPAETPEPEQGAEETAQPQEAAEEAPQPEEGEDKPKGKDYQSRINRLVWEQREAQRQLEETRKRLEEYEQKDKEPATTPEPKMEDFEDFPQFMQARDKWLLDEARQAVRVEREQEAAKQEQETAAQTQQRRLVEAETNFRQEEAKFREALGDRAVEYDQRAEQLAGYLMGPNGQLARPDLAAALFEAGPAVVDHLSSHLDQFAELAQSDPMTAGLQLGALKSRLSDKGRQGAKYRTPPPEKTLGGAGAGGQAPLSEVSEEEYMQRRMKELGITK